VIKRPKLERFSSALPSYIGMSDIDGVIEINGKFLFIEWKSCDVMGLGQRILFKRLTEQSANFTVLIVVGDAQTMNVTAMALINGGVISEIQAASFRDVHAFIAEWAEQAQLPSVCEEGKVLV